MEKAKNTRLYAVHIQHLLWFQTAYYGGGQKRFWPDRKNRVDHTVLPMWSNFFALRHYIMQFERNLFFGYFVQTMPNHRYPHLSSQITAKPKQRKK